MDGHGLKEKEKESSEQGSWSDHGRGGIYTRARVRSPRKDVVCHELGCGEMRNGHAPESTNCLLVWSRNQPCPGRSFLHTVGLGLRNQRLLQALYLCCPNLQEEVIPVYVYDADGSLDQSTLLKRYATTSRMNEGEHSSEMGDPTFLSSENGNFAFM